MHPAQASPSELIVSSSSAARRRPSVRSPPKRRSNLSSGSDSSSTSSWGSPDPRLRPFGPGHQAPYPASYPAPAGGGASHHGPGFLLPFGRRHSLLGSSCSRPGTGPSSRSAYRAPQCARTRTGFPRSALRDTTGVGASSTPGTAVLSRPDAVPGQRLPLPSGQSLLPRTCIPPRGYSSRGINGGSRDSPVRPAPGL
jgi:hypothetical protein